MRDYLQQKMAIAQQLLPLLRASGRAGLQELAPMAGRLSQELVAPVAGRISQLFGNVNPALYRGVTKGARHLGLDIAVPTGTAVRSPVSGRVERGFDPSGFGNYVRVVAPDGRSYQLSHLSNYAQGLGNQVAGGALLGYSGNTGRSTGAHLDLSVKQDGKYIDPLSIDAFKRAYQKGS